MEELIWETRMGDARTRHVLQSIATRAARRRRAVVATGVALALGLLALGWQLGALAGLALVLAVLMALVAAELAVRLRSVERSCAALARSVEELTARIERLPTVAGGVEAVAGPAAGDHVGTGAVPGDVAETDSPADNAGSSANLSAGESPGLMVTGDARNAATDADVAGPPVDAPVAASELVVDADGPDDEEPGVLAVGPGQNAAEASPVVVDEVVETVGGSAVTLGALPDFALTSLRGETVSAADLVGEFTVIVFWRPGCAHCQRLTAELVAWESLQGPRLVVIAACDGPTAFRAGLPGTVLLDSGFTVGQALGAPGTPAALPIDAAGRPSGPVVAGASAVTTLLLDAMREWASTENASAAAEPVDAVEVAPAGDEAAHPVAPPTVLLRRVEEIRVADDASAPDWDAAPVSRRVG